MGTLNDHLQDKREALRARKKAIDAGELAPKKLSAKVSAEGRSGVRRVRMRDFQFITDAPPDLAGFNLGPSAPEFLLGGLGSCLVHTFVMQAAWQGISVNAVDVEVFGTFDPRCGHPGFPEFPAQLNDIGYVLHVDSPASDEDLANLRKSVELYCPMFNVVNKAHEIYGNLQRGKYSSS